MELRSRFILELRRLDRGRVLDLPPSTVAEAVRTVLGLPGAGIVMMNRLVRLPVGASGAHVPRAEQIQMTLNQGPCVTSGETGEALLSSERDIRERWPVYHAALVGQTPFRSTMSLPLRQRQDQPFGALDVYSTDPELRTVHPVDVVAEEVGDVVAMLLLGAMSNERHLLTWPPSEELRERQDVWVAVGMVREAAGVSDTDALAILRAHAFRTDLLLDVVVRRLLARELSTREVVGAD